MSSADTGDLIRLATKYAALGSLLVAGLIYSIETRQMAVAATEDIAWMKRIVFATYINSLNACVRSGATNCITDPASIDSKMTLKLGGDK